MLTRVLPRKYAIVTCPGKNCKPYKTYELIEKAFCRQCATRLTTNCTTYIKKAKVACTSKKCKPYVTEKIEEIIKCKCCGKALEVENLEMILD